MKRLLTVPIMKLAWSKPVMDAEALPGALPTRCILRNCMLAMALSDGSNEPILYSMICTCVVSVGCSGVRWSDVHLVHSGGHEEGWH